MLVTMMLAAAAAASTTERVTLDHAGRSLAADYRAELALTHKQVGAHAGTRPGTRRCDWTATMTLHRDVATPDGTAIAALSRPLGTERAFSGSRNGECAAQRASIEKEVAQSEDRMRTRLAEVIERDRSKLLAELESIGPVMAARAR